LAKPCHKSGQGDRGIIGVQSLRTLSAREGRRWRAPAESEEATAGTNQPRNHPAADRQVAIRLIADLDQALTAFIESMRHYVEQQLLHFAQAESAWRRDGDSTKLRLRGLRWDADDYLKRLGTEKAVLVVQAEDRERLSQERAYPMTEAIVAGRDRRAEEWCGHGHVRRGRTVSPLR
jgi:hypothetical protein